MLRHSSLVPPRHRVTWSARRAAISGHQLVVALGLCLAARGEPYTPASDDEVLERLPPGIRSADLRKQREELSADPENLRDSVAMAASYLETATTEGDPRFLGYAQAILGPWWDQAAPPVPVLVARAQIRTVTAEFDRAMADVEDALARDAGNLPALRLRFDVQMARGDFKGAESTLAAVGPTVSPLSRATLRARLDRMTGSAEHAYRTLSKTLVDTSDGDPAERHFALGLLADLARQLGWPDEARAHFDQLGKLGRRDVAQLAAYADWMLEHDGPDGVLDLLRDETGIDVLDVRTAEALAALSLPAPEQVERRTVLVRQLAARFDARRKRGEAIGLTDDIRFRLRLTQEPGVARARAGELWAVRRELNDVRWVLEAAVASGDRPLAKPVLDWLRSHGIQDARMTRSIQALEGGE